MKGEYNNEDKKGISKELMANGSSDTVYLRGRNAGGWLIQESWMIPTNAKNQKNMMNTFKSRFTESVRDQLIDVYEDSYWTLSPCLPTVIPAKVKVPGKPSVYTD